MSDTQTAERFLTVMMKDYAKWIPDADRNRNRNAINNALAAPVLKEGTNETY